MHRDSQCIVGSLTIKQTAACLAWRTLTVKMLWNGGQLIMNASVFITRVLLFPYRGIVPNDANKQIYSSEYKGNGFMFYLFCKCNVTSRELHPAVKLLQIDAT